jgi:nucleotide-binding universal stress UspA family protein
MPSGSCPPIVVGVDGSEDSRQAVAWAAGVARFVPATALHLIEAVSLPPIPVGSWLLSAESLIAAAESDARERLEGIAAGLRDQGLATNVHVRRWLPVESVIELAAEVKAGLIAVGRRGRSVRQVLLGSVSGELSRRANVPVAVIRDGRAASPPRRVLVALDGSPASAAAATATRAWFPDAEILAVTVGNGSEPGSLEAEALLRPLEGAPGLRAIRREGDPAEVLLELASREAIDLLCAGRRGKGSLQDLLVGGVAEKLLQLAPVPLLLAH